MLAVPLVIALNHWLGWRIAFLLTAAIGLSWIPVWLVATSDPHIKDVLARIPSAEDEQTTTREPASRWSLLASPAVLRAVMLVCFSAPALMFGINWSSKYLALEFALSQDALARYLWVPMVLFDLGAVGFGAIASRIDACVLCADPAAERTSHVLLILMAGGLGATMAAVPLVHSPWLATALISTTMAGGGALFALLTADMLARVPPSHVSTAAGLTAYSAVASVRRRRAARGSHLRRDALVFERPPGPRGYGPPRSARVVRLADATLDEVECGAWASSPTS